MPTAALGLLWLVAGGAITAIGIAGMRGRLPRQHWAGIRLPSTMRSDEAWNAAHRAGGPWLLAAGLVPAACGLSLVLARPGDELAAAVSLAAAGWLLAMVVAAGVVGVRAVSRR